MSDQSLTVVVVDDEPDIAEMYQIYLTRLGHKVQTATSGNGALDLVDDNTDIVFLDRQMPDMTGDDVIHALRENGYPGYVAMVTAVDPDFDVLELGFNAYLTKPVTQEDFQNVISSYRARTTYSTLLQQYFDLLSKKSSLESYKPNMELEGHEEYGRLQAQIEELEAEIGATITALDDEDITAIFYELS